MWYASGNSWTPLTAVDISASGMGVIALGKFEKEELNFRIQVQDKIILARARHVWCTQGMLHGKAVFRYGLTYTGIGADDWDALVRFCNNEAVTVENKAQKELEMVRMQADDVARLIPQRLQERFLTLLVEARRLAPVEKDKTPLVQYFYGGTMRKNNRMLHRLSIHSKINDELTGEPLTFDTRFLFDENGTEIEMEKR